MVDVQMNDGLHQTEFTMPHADLHSTLMLGIFFSGTF
jgi:hypothetical protein